MNFVMQSRSIEPGRKAQLAYDFGVIAAWAQDRQQADFKSNLGLIHGAATSALALTSHSNPAESLRHAPGIVHGMDEMISLGRELRKRPEGDPDRTNTHLRTAVRRVEDLRKKDVWHIQLT